MDSLKEDIKILEDFIKYFEVEAVSRKYRRNISITVGEDDIEAIENLIKGYRESERKIKTINDNERMIKQLQDRINNSIPKSKIKEKIEELEKQYKQMEQTSDFIIADIIQPKIQVLQELMEDKYNGNRL